MGEPLKDLARTLYTAAHLRPRQITTRIRRSFGAGGPRAHLADGLTHFDPRRLPPSAPQGRWTRDGVVLLHQSPHHPLRDGWQTRRDDLWNYTLHYHGWLSHPETPALIGRRCIVDWIERCRGGVGWDPYPTSMRLMHWATFLARHGPGFESDALQVVRRSIAAQAQALGERLEFDIDGNHLWSNLCALGVIAGCGRGPVAEFAEDLVAEYLPDVLQRQVLDDGVHAERTPSYHALVADQLGQTIAVNDDAFWAKSARYTLDAMVEALDAWLHPDGDVALWGDSFLGAACSPAWVRTRWGRGERAGAVDAPHAGLYRRTWGRFTVLFNRGDIGLAYQPGHIHADAGAIEVSLDDERVVVDAGVGTYAVGEARDYARSTAAHNTVETCGLDTHELWRSHRIARRGLSRQTACTPRELAIETRPYHGKARHRRRLSACPGGLLIDDEVIATAGHQHTWRLHIPAEHALTPIDQGFRIVTAGGRRFRVLAQDATLNAGLAPGWTDFGREHPRKMLYADFAGRLRVRILRDD